MKATHDVEERKMQRAKRDEKSGGVERPMAMIM